MVEVEINTYQMRAVLYCRVKVIGPACEEQKSGKSAPPCHPNPSIITSYARGRSYPDRRAGTLFELLPRLFLEHQPQFDGDMLDKRSYKF